jgi:hypothetical protein
LPLQITANPASQPKDGPSIKTKLKSSPPSPLRRVVGGYETARWRFTSWDGGRFTRFEMEDLLKPAEGGNCVEQWPPVAIGYSGGLCVGHWLNSLTSMGPSRQRAKTKAWGLKYLLQRHKPMVILPRLAKETEIVRKFAHAVPSSPWPEHYTSGASRHTGGDEHRRAASLPAWHRFLYHLVCASWLFSRNIQVLLHSR